MTNRGTCEYASIISEDVAWNRSSGPVVPAALVQTNQASIAVLNAVKNKQTFKIDDSAETSNKS